MFASCQDDSDGCPDSVLLAVEEGGDVLFDAIVVHTPGGSCGFRQEITSVQLVKINPELGVPDEQLLSCDNDSVTCSNSRVSLSRGNDLGYEYIFTLHNFSLSRDAGIYQVVVGVVHPATGIPGQITKRFVIGTVYSFH